MGSPAEVWMLATGGDRCDNGDLAMRLAITAWRRAELMASTRRIRACEQAVRVGGMRWQSRTGRPANIPGP